jgi:thiol-disulfide isomerase/thioredoxin
MCQGDFCGFCTKAKPEFKKLSEMNHDYVCSTIKIDGDEKERVLARMISKWDKNYRGVPTYLIFDKNGSYVKTANKGRDAKSLLVELDDTARNHS